MMAPGTARIAATAACAAASAASRLSGHHEEVAAADGLCDAEALLDDELAVHHGDAPQTTAVQHLLRWKPSPK